MSARDNQAMQVLSDAGAQCGACGDEPGDRTCPDCEHCYRQYVAALRAAGWAPRAEVLAEAAAGRGRVTNADRLTVLRAFARDYQGDITTRVVQQRYFSAFGPGDWRAKARQDLAQLTGEGLLLLDETDPGRRVFRFNQVGAPRG